MANRRVMMDSGEVSFDEMLTLRCKYCGNELKWCTTLPAPNAVVYVASCCGVLYQGKAETIMLEIEDTRMISVSVCKCGHEKAEHDRDKGCLHRTETVLFHDVTFGDECGCWRFRARSEEQPL